MPELGKTLVVFELLLAGVGAVLMLGDRLPFKLGRLPGDIVWQGKNTTFYFPIVTLLLLNALLAMVVWLFNRR